MAQNTIPVTNEDSSDTLSTTGDLRGVNESHILREKNGSKWIFKPMNGEYVSRWRLQPPKTCYLREVAAFQLDQILGFRLVPPTKLIEYHNEIGSAQRWLGGATMSRSVDTYKEDDIEKFGILDFLMAQSDRHVGNWLSGKDGRPIAIDNGYSFASKCGEDLTKSAIISPFAHTIKRQLISEKNLDAVRNTSLDNIADILSRYLDEDAIQCFADRYKHLIDNHNIHDLNYRIIFSIKKRKNLAISKMLKNTFGAGDLVNIRKDDIFDEVDNLVIKAASSLPRGAKTISNELLSALWKSFIGMIKQWLQGIRAEDPVFEIAQKLDAAADEWISQIWINSSPIVEDLYRVGFVAGVGEIEIGKFTPMLDPKAIQWIKDNPNGFLQTLKTFNEEARVMFKDSIVQHFFDPEKPFSLDAMRKDLQELAEGERYKFDRIVRTETSRIIGGGRLSVWKQDPMKYYYEYQWNATPDNRAKNISILRWKGNPWSFDEIIWLWEHQEQFIDGRWEADQYNQRCTVSRSPIDHEFVRNIFYGREGYFKET